MNHLNSVIIEGTVLKAPTPIGDGARFTVVSTRYFKKDGKPERKTVFVEIYTSGVLSEVALKHLKENRQLRVIGRLDSTLNEEDGFEYECIIVHAEHLEIKPELREKT